MDLSSTQLGSHLRLNTDFASAVERVTAALKAEGFGVLTAIDVRETFRHRLGVDFRPYTILGACNPPLAHQALTLAPEIGLLLPCNVVVDEVAPGNIDVALVDPLALLGLAGETQLEPIAQAVRTRLERVAAALKA